MEIYYNDSTGIENFCESINQQTAVLSNEDVSELYRTCFVDYHLYPTIRYKTKNQSENCWKYLSNEVSNTVFTYELCFLIYDSGIICLKKIIETKTIQVSTTTIVIVVIVATAALIGFIVVLYKKFTKVSIKKISYLIIKKR